jgi:hypothetical protein
MADSVLFISWGQATPGREERGLEVFNEAIGFYGKWQQEGRIDSFDLVLFNPNADMNGYVEVRGTTEQLNAIQQDDDYRRVLVEATLVCSGMRVLSGATREGIAREMELYQGALSRVPQTA